MPTDPPNLSESLKELDFLCEAVRTEVADRIAHGEGVRNPIQMTHAFSTWPGNHTTVDPVRHTIREADLRFFQTCAKIAKIVLEHSPAVVLEGMTAMPPDEQIIIDLEKRITELEGLLLDKEMMNG